MKKLFLLFCCCIALLKCYAQYHYPATKMVDSIDTYFGVTYHDPYRWLEHMKDTAVVSWFKQQAQFSNNILDRIKGRDSLIAEWRMLAKLQPAPISGIVYKNGRLFYKKITPGEKVAKLYWRQGETGTENLLFDPLHYEAGKTLTIEDFVPSFDGKLLAVSYSQKGAEVATMKIVDVSSGRFLADSVSLVRNIEGWTPDNSAVLYLSLKTADNTDPNGHLNIKTRLHRIGADPATDADFFSAASYPELQIPAKSYPYAIFDENNPGYVLSNVSTVQRDMTAYYAQTNSAGTGRLSWKPVCAPRDHIVNSMLLVNGRVYGITYNGAKNYKLVSSPISDLDWAHAKTEVAEKPDESLKSFWRTKDYLLLVYGNGITDRLYRYSLATGKTDPVKLPIDGNVTIIRQNWYNVKTNNTLLAFTSNIQPTHEFALDAATESFTQSPFNAPPAYPAAFTSLIEKNVEVKGHDGVMVPLTIIYRKGTKLDGNNVCLMDSYGAYGISMDPGFFIYEISLAVRGVVVAVPHVRGGSEKGQDWYMAGYKTTKPNTWKDFNSCGEYLIANGYTQAKKLCGWGTSAGGILISRAITERPDLYGAVICNVGCANAMRLEFTANGPANIPEFGTVKDSVLCRALYEMDGMQHVVKGTNYPAVICVGGWNDYRVVAWQPAKFAAALQNASSSGKPVLMDVNYDNGHFTEDKEVTYHDYANQIAFVMWQCGQPGFELKEGN